MAANPIAFAAHWSPVRLTDTGEHPGISPPVAEVMPLAPKRGEWATPAASKERRPEASFSRAELETLASGSIASVFGPLFAAQEGYRRQVRMPMPPLLLADRVTRLVGAPASHGTGAIWTQTDITPDAWYLHHGRMPAGIVVEAGQADLLLCSWLGADLKNRGERVYRLLGCDLVFHDHLPGVGETLDYEIHLTGHAELGGVRLFFFHSECSRGGRPLISVRNGQAGFFSDAELAASEGVLWSPESAEDRPAQGRVDVTLTPSARRSFDEEAVRQFTEGRLFDCFGPGFELGASHTRSPGIPDGNMRLFDVVTQFDPAGGPWGLGYLRAERPIRPDDWFFEGHFKDDPCMPGTLMCEGGMQAMAFYLAAHGVTLKRDGWRFEPMPGERFRMRCRGQVTPASRRLVYELFVRELVPGPEPVLRADLLCSVDGLKAFHSAGAALRLAPGWPGDLQPPPPRTSGGEVDVFSEQSAQAVALGQPSLAFGKAFERFDHAMRGPRLPGPPYHFITRILSAKIPDGRPRPGAEVEAAYDVPPDAWYFDANGARSMPFAVLLEIGLQPCGWLATAVGCPLNVDQEVFFRNLDGIATRRADVTPESGRIVTHATLTSVSMAGPMILVSFEVVCAVGSETVLQMKTGFGFFPEAALEKQVGRPITAVERESLDRPANLHLDLRAAPPALCAGRVRLAAPPLLMLDRIDGHWREAGRAGLGVIRGEKDVDPREWFFKAHFFQDPVQPGSLGIEALLQLLQALMLREGMDEGIAEARFEPMAFDREVIWKCRGQVIPTDGAITTLVEVLERGRDERGAYAVAEGTLLVDGRKIYHLPKFGARISPAGLQPGRARAASPSGANREQTEELTLDPARDVWLNDHCPTFVIPVLPLMVAADLMAGAAIRLAPGLRVVGLQDLKLRSWIAFAEGPRRLRIEVSWSGADRAKLRLLVWRQARRAEMSRFDLVATAEALFAEVCPPAPDAWKAALGGTVFHGPDGDEAADLYGTGATFHGPAFRRLRKLCWNGPSGYAEMDGSPGDIPSRLLNPVLLDAIAQAIVGDHIARFDPTLSDDSVAFPAALERLSLFAPLPTSGSVACVLRYLGLGDPEKPNPRFAAQLQRDGAILAEAIITMAVIQKGRIGTSSPSERRDFALRRRAVPGISIGRRDGKVTRVLARELAAQDWLPGTVARIYGATPGDHALLMREVAAKDHLAAAWGLHPAEIVLDVDGVTGRSAGYPQRSQSLVVTVDSESVSVADVA